MQVRVERVSAIPHNAQIFIDDQVECYTIYMLQDLIAEESAELLSVALTALVSNRRRRISPQLRSHTG